MIIEELKVDYGSSIVTKRFIQNPNQNNRGTMLSLDCINGRIDGVAFSFNGNLTNSTSPETIEELRRFKALLNSFEEL